MPMVVVAIAAAILLAAAMRAVSGAGEPMNCTDTTRVCTSFLAFRAPAAGRNLSLIDSMFDTSDGEITVDSATSDLVFLRKNCSCLASRRYFANTTYTITAADAGGNATAYAAAEAAYGGLAAPPPVSALVARPPRAGAVVALHLLCGCSSGLWNYMLTYVADEGDSIEGLASRFGVSMDAIETANAMAGPQDPIIAGSVYYLPLNDVPGVPYAVMPPPSRAPAPSPTIEELAGVQNNHSTKFSYIWVIGFVGVASVLVALVILFVVSYKFFCYHFRVPKSEGKQTGNQAKQAHKFQLLKNSSFCYGSGRYLCCQFGDQKPSGNDQGDINVAIPRGIVVETVDLDKPTVFTYQEINSSTRSFSDANLLGRGTYGSVYYGVLRNQEVAIKRMAATKTKEFIVEMRILCKVHHSSLVELIGYAASNDELFLVYEYAQKGSLKNHLQDPESRGYTSLTWISRVQIALDAARGLEYIHEHTKNQYVHRDVKTSNILLDSSLRAKISDFGLAKLVASNEGEASATRVVGTFGYLAPEYLRDGFASTKSDVYAFGVVLFELISGKEAITRTEGMVSANSERRSLASLMIAVMRNCPNSMCMEDLKACIDPSLMNLYPHDCAYKMAVLAKQCTDEDPIMRPDMKQVVITLSQILLSSIEWEAALAGNSQVFSALVQGR